MTPELKAELMEEIKAAGLATSEEALVALVQNSFDLLQIVVPKFSAGIGALVPAMRGIVESPLLGLIDKIDGKDNPNY